MLPEEQKFLIINLPGLAIKIHLAVETKSELPVALKVTTAHIKDGDMGPPLGVK